MHRTIPPPISKLGMEYFIDFLVPLIDIDANTLLG